jgi:ABC-type multidrug transport system fused ATPase/permease subunit
MSYRLNKKFGPWLFFHALEFKWYYLGAFLSLFVLQEMQSSIPQKVRELTQLWESGRGQSWNFWIFLGLALGILIFRTLSRLLFFYPARVQQKFIRIEILDLLEKVPYARFSHLSQGKIFQILFDDISNLRAFVGFGLLQIFNIIISLIVLIPKVNETDSYLWPAFIPLFLSVLLFTILSLWNEKIFKKMLEKKDLVQQFIIETYEAKQSIKNFHKEEEFVKKFSELSQNELKLFFKSSLGYAFVMPYVKLGLGMSLLWAALLIRSRGGGASDLIFFAGFLYLFLEPVIFLSWVAIVTSQGLAAWKRVKELIAVLTSSTQKEIDLRNIEVGENLNEFSAQFYFWNQKIPLCLKKNQWTVIIGETGCGKSTLMTNLALCFRMGGRKISMVQQEPYLFNGTIKENIFLGATPDFEKLKLLKDLYQVFQMNSVGVQEEKFLELEVGENGKRLSGGQVKRVALIRSLLSDAEVFIWDDPFSSLDIILEKKVMSFLKTHFYWSKKTFLISSHRLTAVKLCDQLIFIEKAGIICSGEVSSEIKGSKIEEFFREQMVEYPVG